MTASASPVWFLDFFYLLRSRGLKVSMTEWMTFLRGLLAGLHEHSLHGFYELGRMTLVKTEADLDEFDVAFKHYFDGKEMPPLAAVRQEILDWLANPRHEYELSPEEQQELAQTQTSLEELLERYQELLDRQDERHDGGNTWIGTGGTSPYGNNGAGHQPGFKVGGEAGARSAVAVAGERRYQGYRDDVILDTRQFKMALKRLRLLAKEGQREELDLDQTIDATCRNAGEIDLIFEPGRKNSVKLLLLMDTGGSMSPYAALCNVLFSAAHQMSHFKDLQHFYFHNCIYQYLYRDEWGKWSTVRTTVPEFLHKYDRSYKVIFVGDACMAPHELHHQWYGDGRSGYDVFSAIRAHFTHAVWLNPEPRKYWNHETITAVRKLYPMFPLTVKGLEGAVAELLVKR